MNLFHYTSIETFFNIFEKSIVDKDPDHIRFELWATHAGFLNDLTEGQLLTNALRKLGVQEGVLNGLFGVLGYPFVVSLSELDDDLNMWRCYADHGKGVALGFDKSCIEEAMTNQEWFNIAEFTQCKYYTEDELVDYLKSNHVESLLLQEDKRPLYALLNEALKFKNKSFFAEGEWRLYANYVESGFKLSNNLIVPYYKILLPIEAIVSITLGPKCDYVRNSFSIYRLIKSKIGEEWANRIFIMKSQVPLG